MRALSPFKAARTPAAVVWLHGLLVLTAVVRAAAPASYDVSRLGYAADMNLAQLAWERGDFVRVQSALAETAIHTDRGFEWFFLDQRLRETWRSWQGHERSVSTVAFSPDGHLLASGSADDTVRLWDVKSQQLLKTLRGHRNMVWCLAFFPDGSRLVSSGGDGRAILWDIRTGQEVLTLPKTRSRDWLESSAFRQPIARPSGRVEAVAVSPDGEHVVTGDDAGNAMIWSARTGEPERAIEAHRKTIHGVAFTPDGSRLVTSSYDKTAKVWDVQSGREMMTLEGHTNAIESHAISADGRHLITGSHDGTARIWDLETGKELRQLPGPRGGVMCVAFAPDGQRVATGGETTASIWVFHTGAILKRYRTQGATIDSCAFSPDGRWLALVDLARRIALWNVTAEGDYAELTGQDQYLYAIRFSPDGRRLVTGGIGKTVETWDATTHQQLARCSGHDGFIQTAIFLSDGRRVASAGDDHSVRIWDAATGTPLVLLLEHGDRVNSLAGFGDGRRLASGSNDGTVRIWDLSNERSIATLDAGGAVVAVAVSPDDTSLALAVSRRGVLLCNLTGTDMKLGNLTTNLASCVTFSPDGASVLAGHYDQTARLYDPHSGKELLTLAGHESELRAVAFSPDGRRILTSCKEMARIWDAATGRELLSLPGLTRATFSAGGQHIAGIGRGRARIYSGRPPAEMSETPVPVSAP